MKNHLYKIKQFMNLDLIVFGLVCIITFFLCGRYMSAKKRQTISGKIEICAINFIFWVGIFYGAYAVLC